jgi:hypothetical protein
MRAASRHGGEAELLEAPAHRALADGREAARVRDALRLGSAVDVREDDALRAVVEHARRVPVLEARHPHDRRHAHRERGRGDLRRGVGVHRVVLAIDEQPIEAAGGGDLGGVDGARLAQPQADGELPGAQLAQGMIRNGGHSLSSKIGVIG